MIHKGLNLKPLEVIWALLLAPMSYIFIGICFIFNEVGVWFFKLFYHAY